MIDPRYVSFDSYAYLLEAAAAGRGIAMGWRFFVESQLASGALIALADGFVEHDHHFICIVTAKGQGNPYARECLRFFEEIEPLALSQL